jgi:hypothetical protein
MRLRVGAATRDRQVTAATTLNGETLIVGRS